MELRESLAEAREAADRHVCLESLRQRVDEEFEARSAQLHTRFMENSEPARRQARNLVREMQFLQKLAHEVEELE
jgi:DnaJ-domain-containing protein 1